MKKTLAILLALALVLCMMPSAAFAATTIDGTVDSISIDPIADQTYTGSEIKPAISVKATISKQDGTSEVLQLSADDYTATWENNVDAGTNTASVTVTYGETTETAKQETQTFTIKPYDLAEHKVSATVANQIENFSSVAEEDISYFADGKEATGSLRAMLVAQIKVSVSNGVVSFAPKNNNLSGTIASVTPKVAKNINTCTITPATNVYYDGTVKNAASLVSVNTSSSNYTVTSVGEIKDKGTYTLTIKGKGDYAGSTSCTVTVNARNSSYVSIAAIPDQVENKISIDPAVTDVINGKTVTLTKGTDYNIGTPEFNKTVSASTDQYKATIYFIGNYTNDKVVYFNVVKSDYDINLVSATMSTNSAYMYNGKTQTPVISVTKNGSSFSSSYYTVSYEYADANGKTVSTTTPVDAKVYSVYLVGRSPYAGKKYVGVYTIPKFKFDYVDITATQGSNTNVPNVVVKSLYDDIIFVKDKDYTVSNAWISTSTNKGYVTVSSTGTGNLDTGSKSITYALVAKNISYCTTEFAAGSKATYQYTGSAITPKVKVRDGYTVLTEGTDYSIAYKDASGKAVTPRDAGTYTIEITGKGAYSGTTTMSFTIVGIDISGYTVTLKEASVKADGYRKVPTIVSVKNGFYSTLSSTDYTVSYEDSTGKTVTTLSAPGTYKVVVTGKNGYTGSTYATYRIVGTPQEIKIDKTAYKVYKDSEPFRITASATGDGTGFSYVSSNPAVATVSANGVVTIHKIGRAKITVTTTGMKLSEPVSDEVYVKVYPDKTKITQKPQTEGNKGSFRVRWEKQDDVTYYEIRYARNSSFRSGTYLTKKVNASTLNYTTQSTKITGLKSGARYYVKVRAVKVVYNDYGQELKYYGKWSNWRSVVTK